ncbi:MAG: GAF domain-containing protein [Symploca sp. SIO2G7]|nr:GAF domain-containing protein [Symploca sp. SIO2G7]
MLPQDLPLSLVALEATIDPHPLTVVPETPLIEVVNLLNQVQQIYPQPQKIPPDNLNQSLDILAKDKAKASCVLVVEGGKLLGLLTELDVIKFVATGINLEEVQAGSVVTPSMITLRASDFRDIFTVVKLLEQHHLRYLPIVDDRSQLVGLVTSDHLLKVLGEEFQELRQLISSLQHQTKFPANPVNRENKGIQGDKALSSKTTPYPKVELLHNCRVELEEELVACANQVQEQVTREQLLGTITQLTYQSVDLETICNTTVEQVRQYLKSDRVIIYRLESQGNGVIVAESVNTAWQPIREKLASDSSLEKIWFEPYTTGCIDVIDDIYTADISSSQVELLAQLQVRANLAVPIVQGEQLWGLLIAQQCSAPRQWCSSEIDLLEKLATQIAIAIKQFNLLEQYHSEVTTRKYAQSELKRAHELLKVRFEEWAAELQQINQQLQPEIAKRQQTEKELAEARDQLQAVLDAVPGYVSWINSDFQYLGVNQQLANLFKLSPEDFASQKIGFLQSSYEFAEYGRQFFALSQANTSIEFEMELDGYKHTYLVVAQKYNHNQSAVFIGIDITQRKWMEEAVRISAATNRALLNAIPDVMYRISRDGTFVNYKAAKDSDLFSSPSEFLGKKVDQVLPAEVAQPILQSVKEALQTGNIQIFEYQFPRNGKMCNWEARIVVSEINEVMAIVRDITERKQAEEELRKTLQKEKELNELKSRFVCMTSHEFRTPLTTILSSSELLQHYRDKWTEEKKVVYFGRIQSSVKHMTRLLDDVLLIGKVEAGKLGFNPERMDLVKFCRTLVEDIRLGNGNKHQIIFNDIDISEPEKCKFSEAYMDEKLLKHIFSNLLSNAIKYSPQDSSIHFQLTYQDGEAIFQIKDQGIGIPPEAKLHLFDSFYRANNVGNISGNGLGLAIVKSSIDLHNGKITVDSEVDLGTTFTVTIPLNVAVRC